MTGKKSSVILLVEDDDGLRLTLREYLQGKGYQVLVATDGVGAIKHLLDSEVDLIISDYRMDVFGGDYWLRFLQRYCNDIDIILTSGFLKYSSDVPFEFIEKPFQYSDLTNMVERMLSEKDKSRKT